MWQATSALALFTFLSLSVSCQKEPERGEIYKTNKRTENIVVKMGAPVFTHNVPRTTSVCKGAWVGSSPSGRESVLVSKRTFDKSVYSTNLRLGPSYTQIFHPHIYIYLLGSSWGTFRLREKDLNN